MSKISLNFEIQSPLSPQIRSHTSLFNNFSRQSVASPLLPPNHRNQQGKPRASFMVSQRKTANDFNNILNEINNESNEGDNEKARSISFSKMKRLNLDSLSQEQLLELAITILQKPPEFRNSMDIKMLERSTKNVEFFQKYDKDTHEHICKHMIIHYAPKDTELFKINSFGDTFYIILKGSVEVWVNLPHIVEEVKPDGSIEQKTEIILSHVRTLFAGNSFGELALLENKPRAATIICKQQAYFGVLDKTSFDNILKEKEKRKLYEKIDFFAAMKIFGKWSYNAVKLLYYQTDLLDFILNQCAIREGQEALGLYLIKSGEFKMKTKILIKFTEEDQEEHALSRGVLQDYYKTIEVFEKPSIYFKYNFFYCYERVMCIEHWRSYRRRRTDFWNNTTILSLLHINQRISIFSE